MEATKVKLRKDLKEMENEKERNIQEVKEKITTDMQREAQEWKERLVKLEEDLNEQKQINI